MIIPEEVICPTCDKVFCCSTCREKHEFQTHAIIIHPNNDGPSINLLCPICQKKPLVLHANLHTELLIHVTNNHLPLNCCKCSRIYTKAEDLLEFSKCVQNNVSCKLEIAELKTVQMKQQIKTELPKILASSVSTQTSFTQSININESQLTPISMINLRWKAKSKITEEFISDSVSSIKNISSINNSSIRKSLGVVVPVKGKLVRSTSTPLQAEVIAKPKEPVFNASGGHVSSIYSSISESESSPPIVLPTGTPSTRPLEGVNRYQKARGHPKMSKAVTPLRQVMSKSIQKAIFEHGMGTAYRGTRFNRKKMFDSIDSSGEISEKTTEIYPLDLRLSPALRRTQSEIINGKSDLELISILPKATPRIIQREILKSSTKKTTESILIRSTSKTEETVSGSIRNGNQSGGSIYQTCRSVEIVTSTSTQLSEVNVNESDVVKSIGFKSPSVIPHITPRIPSFGVSTHKKVIKFETPVLLQKCKSENHSPDEQFFTPTSTPVRASKIFKNFQPKSCCVNSLRRNFYAAEGQENDKIETVGSNYTDVACDDDEVFHEDDNKPQRSGSTLWSLVASVIRLPSLTGEKNNPKLKDTNPLKSESTSLIKRCASYAGSLVRQKAVEAVEESNHGLKRKRTYTIDSEMSGFSNANSNEFDLRGSESKRFRIQGRRPIQRMRCNN